MTILTIDRGKALLWIEALESGRYVQGQTVTRHRRADGVVVHCGVGVGEDVAMRHGAPLQISPVGTFETSDADIDRGHVAVASEWFGGDLHVLIAYSTLPAWLRALVEVAVASGRKYQLVPPGHALLWELNDTGIALDVQGAVLRCQLGIGRDRVPGTAEHAAAQAARRELCAA